MNFSTRNLTTKKIKSRKKQPAITATSHEMPKTNSASMLTIPDRSAVTIAMEMGEELLDSNIDANY
jgi:hypothetical protein